MEAAEDAGLDIVSDDSINKTASEAEALSAIQTLKNAGAEAVFLITSPLVYLALANAARNQSYEPAFIGPGITSGLNAVLSFGCPAVGNGEFFSPFPELDVIDAARPRLPPVVRGVRRRRRGRRHRPRALGPQQDASGLMFDATGDDLGRAALMNTIESGEAFDTGVYPPVEVHPRGPLRRDRRAPAEGRLRREAVRRRPSSSSKLRAGE